jgi:hypothetical protein
VKNAFGICVSSEEDSFGICVSSEEDSFPKLLLKKGIYIYLVLFLFIDAFTEQVSLVSNDDMISE